MSNQKAERKVQERTYLDKFVRQFDGLAEGEIEESECPDFLVQVGSITIGIEVTKLFRDPDEIHPMQEAEALEQRIVDRAEKIHRRCGGPPLHVVVLFDQNKRLSPRGINQLAVTVAGVVERHPPENELVRRKVTNDWRGAGPLPVEVEAIDIWSFPGVTAGCWSVSRGDWVKDCIPRELQAKLDSKRGRYSEYRSRCDTAWLVMVIPGDAPSSLVDVPRSTYEHVYDSPFDRAFVMGGFNGSKRELLLDSGRKQ